MLDTLYLALVEAGEELVAGVVVKGDFLWRGDALVGLAALRYRWHAWIMCMRDDEYGNMEM